MRVLRSALASGNRLTRLRAVAMLAAVSCEDRDRLLDLACRDADAGVRDTARIVIAWILPRGDEVPWPDREDPTLDHAHERPEESSSIEAAISPTWEWEYAVEVWRDDGLLVGVFLSTTCFEDDEHAKRIALGQAILASSGPGADRFDPESAGAFIVGKRRAARAAARERRAGPGDVGSPGARGPHG